MENTRLYIPKKIKAGYQEREDTYSKRLAYVTYYDEKDVLRKETSWTNWTDESLGRDDFDNEPMDGFVLNKNAGGVKNSYSHNVRIEKVRVYDPRGFEIEISLPNLLFILQEYTSSKGKGLEGEFVYSWLGTELILLPVDSEDYKESVKYTKIQNSKTISARDLKVGCSYKTKDMKDIVYIGRHDFYTFEYNQELNKMDYYERQEPKAKTLPYKKTIKRRGHVFYDPNAYTHNSPFSVISNMKTLAMLNSDEVVEEFSDIVDKFNNTIHASSPKEFILTKTKIKAKYITEYLMRKNYVLKGDDSSKIVKCNFAEVNYSNGNGGQKCYGFSLANTKTYQIKDGVLIVDSGLFGDGFIKSKIKSTQTQVMDDYPTISHYYSQHTSYSIEDLNNYGFYSPYVLLENGAKVSLSEYIN